MERLILYNQMHIFYLYFVQCSLVEAW